MYNIWDLLEKSQAAQLLKNFPTFYGSRKFITVFTGALHWSSSWARSIQSRSHHLTYLTSILISSSHQLLNLPRGPTSNGFSIKTCMHFSLSPCVLHSLPIFYLFTWSFYFCLTKSSSLWRSSIILFHTSSVQIFSSATCSQISSDYVLR
jgi:hypothetical protein